MVVILLTSIAFSFKLHAQRVFAPYYDDKDARFLYWDSCRKDYLLVKDYDFGLKNLITVTPIAIRLIS